MANYIVHPLLRAGQWQHRPQLNDVHRWWRDGGRGVCALIGMGGAGKTAITDRFVNDLLTHEGNELRVPGSVFVYSFYEDEKPENFFRCLQVWLDEKSSPEAEKTPAQLTFDIQQHEGLIVLDGLERVQESGLRGGFGRLTSPSLRDLLNHIACGSARNVSVLTTSRFPLADLRDSQPRYFHRIPVDQIDGPTGVQLLRSRGVSGSDHKLAAIVEQCGRHALTVDLAGGYIAEYGQGDANTPLDLGSVETLAAELDDELDEEKRQVAIQGRRFARIAERYREAMIRSDQAAIALLERICLFRFGVKLPTLTAVFTGPDAEKVSGSALAALNETELKKKLDWLVRMRIIEQTETAEDGQTATPAFQIHPAVRDGFLDGLNQAARESGNEAIRKTLDVQLGDRPGLKPSSPEVLDAMEEILHHTIGAEHAREAWFLYQKRMGGFENIGRRLGNFERGMRVCKAIADKAIKEDTTYDVFHDLGMLAQSVGDLSLAESSLRKHLDGATKSHSAHWSLEVLTDVLRLQGRLADSLDEGNRAVSESERLTSNEGIANSRSRRGLTNALMGRVSEALDDFDVALTHQRERHQREQDLFRTRGVLYARALLLLGDHEESEAVTDANLAYCLRRWGKSNRFAPQCHLILAEAMLQRGDLENARRYAERARQWAASRDAKQVTCWNDVIDAKIALEVMRRSPLAVQEGRRRFQTHCDHGLRLARSCGFGIDHIDLLLLRAEVNLMDGDPEAALKDIGVALDHGLEANERTGQAELLPATDERCRYVWAIALGCQLRAEAQLLSVARTLGVEKFDVDRQSELPQFLCVTIQEARKNLNAAKELWATMHDPDAESGEGNLMIDGKPHHMRARDTQRVLDQLTDGVLTHYPIVAGEFPRPSRGAGGQSRAARDKIFISYSHLDADWLPLLEKHLKPFQDRVEISPWADNQIKPGQRWLTEIRKAIAETRAAVLLVSANFIASDFIMKQELPLLIEESENGELTILWIPLKPSAYKHTEIAKYQAIRNPDPALTELPQEQQESEWVKICERIQEAICK